MGRRIRPAGAGDLPALLSLYRDLHETDLPAEERAAEGLLSALMAYSGSAVFLAEVEAALVASCTLIVIPNLTRRGQPYGLIENVVTAREHRNRGHGRAILRAATDAAWSEGCYKVMLLTGRSDPDVLAFYEGAGFAQTKTGFQIRRP